MIGKVLHFLTQFRNRNALLTLVVALSIPLSVLAVLTYQTYLPRASEFSTPPSPPWPISPRVTPLVTSIPTTTVVSQGLFGKAIQFNNESINDSYVVGQKYGNYYNLRNPFTIESWVKVAKPISGSYIRAYSLISYTKTQTSQDYGYIFRLSLETQEQTGLTRPIYTQLVGTQTLCRVNGIQTYCTNNHGYMSVGGASSTSFQPDQWNHIAVTSTSENNTCYLKLYINGSLVDSSQRFQTSCQVSLDQAKEYRIAKPPDGLGGISGYYFVGELDEVRFSDTVRYTGNFTRPSSPFGHDSHDLLLLKFDDRLGRVLDDSGYRIYMTAYGSHVAFVNSTIPSLPMPTTAVACESYSTCESCYSNLSCFYVFNYGGRNFCATNGSALAPIPGMCISAQTVGSRTCDQCRQQLTPTPTAPFMPIATPASLNVSTTNVIMELVKDLQSPSGLTLQNGFTITGAGASGWQLRNNQDATYTPPGGTASPTLGQGFGFYDSSGGITTGSSYTVRAYVNNNKPTGVYQGTYTLQAIDQQSRTSDVARIRYTLTVSDRPFIPGVTAAATPFQPIATPLILVTPTPANTAPQVVTTQFPAARRFRFYVASVIARDTDASDRVVNITISGLPPGLSYGFCRYGSIARCFIYGFPTQSGRQFIIQVRATDTRTTFTTRLIPLIINP